MRRAKQSLIGHHCLRRSTGGALKLTQVSNVNVLNPDGGPLLRAALSRDVIALLLGSPVPS